MQNWKLKLTDHSLNILWTLILLSVIILYGPWGLYYLNDDFIHIPLSGQAVLGQRHSIRIVNDLSLYLDSILYGKNAIGYHLTNFLLHLGNTALLFFTSRKILSLLNLPNSKLIAHATALFFIVYPFHSESVFWVIGRTGALSAVWMQLAFLAQNRKSFWWHLAGGMLYLIGLFTYESVLVYPVIIAAILYYQHYIKTNTKHWLRQLLIALSATILYSIIRITILGSVTDHYESGSLLQGKIIPLFGNYTALFLRLFAPPFKSTFYFVAAAFALMIALMVIIFSYRKKWQTDTLKHLLLISVLLFSLLPYISLGIDTHGVESERYLYLPSLFLAIIAAQTLLWLNGNLRLIFGSLYVLFSLFFLLNSSKSFRTAGAVVKEVLATTNKYLLPTHQRIYFFNMPGEHKGAVLMRMGLPEAVAWLIPAANGKLVLSISPDMNPYLELKKIPKPQLIRKDQFVKFVAIPDSIIKNESLFVAYKNEQLLVAQ